jgi:dCMP deaminase
MTAKIFAESGVRLRQFSPPADGLVDLSIGSGDNSGTKTEDVREVLDDHSFLRPL